MLAIGAFARLGGISVRALRHYEEVGVLVPARIDPATGYRYYRAEQLARLHRILALKDLGLSLQQMRPLLDGELSAEKLSGMLASTRAKLAQRLAADQTRLARVEQRLRYIELEDDMSMDIVIKEIPALRVAEVRYRGEKGLDFYHLRDFSRPAMRTLLAALDAASIRPAGPMFLHYEHRPDGTLTPFAAVPIGDQPFAATNDVEIALLPPITAVVTICDPAGATPGTAGHDIVGPIYGQMARYAEDHGYDIEGPGRDHMIRQGGDKFVMELQLPIAQR